MNNYKNHYRKNRFKSNGDRGFKKRNGNGHKIVGDFNNNLEFKRKHSRNNQNPSKLVDKYNDLAREALSNGDKILSENYLQHADHFSRIITSQEASKAPINNSIDLQENKESTNSNSSKEDNNNTKQIT